MEGAIVQFVVVARCESSGRTYILEEVEVGIYALYNLRSQFTRLPCFQNGYVSGFTSSNSRERKTECHERHSNTEWWSVAAQDAGYQRATEEKSCHLKQTFNGPRIVLSKPLRTASTKTRPKSTGNEKDPQLGVSLRTNAASDQVGDPILQDSDQILQSIKAQYQESLYFSKVMIPHVSWHSNILNRSRLHWPITPKALCPEPGLIFLRRAIDQV